MSQIIQMRKKTTVVVLMMFFIIVFFAHLYKKIITKKTIETTHFYFPLWAFSPGAGSWGKGQ